MVFTLKPFKIDERRKYPKLEIAQAGKKQEKMKYPDTSVAQNNLMPRKEDKAYKTDQIFKIPVGLFLQNMANTLLLTIHDLTKIKNYSNPKLFLSIFMKEQRMLYLGIFLVILAIFVSIFFS